MACRSTKRFAFSKPLNELDLQNPANQRPLEGSSLPYAEWLKLHFPHVCTHPLAERHIRLWEWFDNLAPGSRPRPRVDVWPRGGAKSSTGELGTARVGAKLARRFVLYVSGTQEQADKHVQSIGSLFETLGVERAVNKFGHSRGWRRNVLRTANGFNVAALGLDVAVRGVKLDQYRPDLIVFDDIDDQADTLKTIEKKIASITTAIIPAGSGDCAVLFLQNKIHEESIVTQLCDGRADFLHDREAALVEPAVIGLQYESVDRGDGRREYHVTGGEPTWAGQGLEICQVQMNGWGLKAFLREAQHEVEGADGYVFDVSKLQVIAPEDVPPLQAICLAGDLAATQDGGDHTVLVLIGKDLAGRFYIFAVIRGQWSSDRVRACIRAAASYYKQLHAKMTLHLPQDPGQAGKDQASQFQREFVEFKPIVEPVTGDKATRASGLAEAVNVGNVYLVKQDLPQALRGFLKTLTHAAWHFALRDEMRKFRENELDQVDDQIDAGADAFNEVDGPRRAVRFYGGD